MTRYVLQTYRENGKLKFVKEKQGRKVIYTAKDSNNFVGKVDKQWILNNINYISNAGESVDNIYPVEDRFDSACKTIKEDMHDTLMYGYGLEPVNIAKYTGTGWPSRKNRKQIVEAWKIINKYDPGNETSYYWEWLKELLQKAEKAKHIICWSYLEDQNGLNNLKLKWVPIPQREEGWEQRQVTTKNIQSIINQGYAKLQSDKSSDRHKILCCRNEFSRIKNDVELAVERGIRTGWVFYTSYWDEPEDILVYLYQYFDNQLKANSLYELGKCTEFRDELIENYEKSIKRVVEYLKSKGNTVYSIVRRDEEDTSKMTTQLFCVNKELGMKQIEFDMECRASEEIELKPLYSKSSDMLSDEEDKLIKARINELRKYVSCKQL